jgi:hypothetical protein
LLEKDPADIAWLLLTALGVWRLTAFVAYEAGPFDVATAIRRGLVRVGLARLVGCFYCLSFWMSCSAILVFRPGLDSPLVILGVAGAVAVIERLLTGSQSTGADEGSDHEV